MNKCYVKAYYDWIEQTAALSDAERGRLFIAVLEYARSGLEPKLDGRESILFPVFRATIDRDNKIAKTNAQNGALGGRGNKAVESEQKRNKAVESEQKPTQEKRHKTKTQEKDNDKDKGVKTRDTRASPPTLEEVMAYAQERGKPELARQFFDYFETGNWVDAKGQPVRNWKQKFLTWEKFETVPRGGGYRQPQTQPGPGSCQPPDEDIARSTAWLDDFVRKQKLLEQG